MSKLNIPIIVGTSRKTRKTILAAEYILKIAEEEFGDEVKSYLVDPQDFDLPYDGNGEDVKDPKYTKITKDADAFFIVLPEYNHGYPGSLKRLLDSELKNYIHKPVAFGGVSAGRWGGTRAIESLVPVTRELGMTITFDDVNFPNVGKLFDESGNMLNDELYRNIVKKSLTELTWMTKCMKWGIENLESQHH